VAVLAVLPDTGADRGRCGLHADHGADQARPDVQPGRRRGSCDCEALPAGFPGPQRRQQPERTAHVDRGAGGPGAVHVRPAAHGSGFRPAHRVRQRLQSVPRQAVGAPQGNRRPVVVGGDAPASHTAVPSRDAHFLRVRGDARRSARALRAEGRAHGVCEPTAPDQDILARRTHAGLHDRPFRAVVPYNWIRARAPGIQCESGGRAQGQFTRQRSRCRSFCWSDRAFSSSASPGCNRPRPDSRRAASRVYS
jgi:hypothetical protein